MNLDPNTPVVVGVGQAAERIDDPNYRGMSPVELAAAAARAAVDDCGAEDAGAAIDTVAGVRQFEISGVINAPLGRSNNYPRSVANRIGAAPARAILEIVGGQGPQHLISELAAEIAAGRSQVAMVFGSDATSTRRYFAKAEARPDFTETVDGDLEDRGPGHREARLALHRRPRADERTDPVRAAGECPAGRDRAGAGGVSAADG